MANFVAISGNLTRDVELRFTPQGKAVASFAVAHNTRRYNSQSQQWEDGEATFIDVELWGKKAENLAEEMQSGKKPVTVLGKLVQDRWQDKNTGENRSRHKIVAEDVCIIPTGTQAGQGQSQAMAQAQANAAAGLGQQNAWNAPAPTGQQPPF